MLREIRDLGFQYAELSHGTRISLLPGILEAVDAGEIRISSLHNFCPLPMGVTYAGPQPLPVLGERPRERELAERYTVKTIEFAARVKAPAVVLHAGQHRHEELHGQIARSGRPGPKGDAQVCQALRRAG